jgi:hypothetical protein
MVIQNGKTDEIANWVLDLNEINFAYNLVFYHVIEADFAYNLVFYHVIEADFAYNLDYLLFCFSFPRLFLPVINVLTIITKDVVKSDTRTLV